MRISTRAVITALLASSSLAAKSSELVEGVVEGRLHRSGIPIVGAQITACKDGVPWRWSSLCQRWVDVRTDANGTFRFTQFTGGLPPTEEEARRRVASGIIVDPGRAVLFRVDFDGASALVGESGMGYGTKYIRFDCDFKKYLTMMKVRGARPVANPDKMPAMDCEVLRYR